MWSKFFDSFAAQDDNESVMSGSGLPGMADVNMPPSYPNSPAANHILRGASFSDVYPHDSASAVGDGEPLPALNVGQSSLSHARGVSVSVVDDGTYVFKFRTPAGRTHRFQARNDNFENLRDIVSGKLSTDPFFSSSAEGGKGGVSPDPMDFTLSYTDNDGDTVLITSDTDVADAVKLARKAKSDRVVLFIQGGSGWKEAGAGESEKKAQEVSEAAAREIKEVEKAESAAVPHIVVPETPSTPQRPADDLVFGIPRDLVLPASLGFLGVIIVSVFIASRLSK